MSDVIQLVLNELIDTVVKTNTDKRSKRSKRSKRKIETIGNAVPKLRIKKPKIYKRMESISSISSNDFVVLDDSIGLDYFAEFDGVQSPGLHPAIQRQFSLPLYGGLSPLELPPLSLTPSCDFDPTANLCRITHWRDSAIGIDPLTTAPDGAIGSIFHASDGTKHHFLYGNQRCSKCVRDDPK